MDGELIAEMSENCDENMIKWMGIHNFYYFKKYSVIPTTVFQRQNGVLGPEFE